VQDAEKVCCLSSVPDRALQMLKLVDTSRKTKVCVKRSAYHSHYHNRGMVVDFERYSSAITMTRDFVSIISSIAYRFKGLGQQGKLPSTLLYIADASDSSIPDLENILKPMAAREQQLTSLLEQCSDDSALVEAALEYGTLLKEARKFVVDNDLGQLTLGDVVALVKRVAEDEAAAVEMWGPGSTAWWQLRKENRSSGRAACCDRSFAFVSELTQRATGARSQYSEGRPDFAVAISMADIGTAISTPHFHIDAPDVYKMLLDDRVSGPAKAALAVTKTSKVWATTFLTVLGLTEGQITFVITDEATATPSQLAIDCKKVLDSAELIFASHQQYLLRAICRCYPDPSTICSCFWV
jgi:hypothetical protein